MSDQTNSQGQPPVEPVIRSDRDLREDADTAAQSSTSGGRLAQEIGSRDDAQDADGGDHERTGVHKADKKQPFIPTRADNEGANG